MSSASGVDHPSDRTALVRVELARSQREARATFRRGVVALSIVPIALSASLMIAIYAGNLAGLIAFVLAGIYALVGGIAGFTMMLSGATDHRQSAVQLRAIEEQCQLPAARLVVR